MQWSASAALSGPARPWSVDGFAVQVHGRELDQQRINAVADIIIITPPLVIQLCIVSGIALHQ